MAWWYREYAHEQPTQERLVYRDEEENARAARRGLWKDAKPVPLPSAYRPRLSAHRQLCRQNSSGFQGTTRNDVGKSIRRFARRNSYLDLASGILWNDVN
jgi:hypothetical protein